MFYCDGVLCFGDNVLLIHDALHYNTLWYWALHQPSPSHMHCAMAYNCILTTV